RGPGAVAWLGTRPADFVHGCRNASSGSPGNELSSNARLTENLPWWNRAETGLNKDPDEPSCHPRPGSGDPQVRDEKLRYVLRQPRGV
ncbi:hypothetical protein, partial [Frankia sp. CiP3]|uniref:hypothetical protein n=1 Tax=Frankia sp. CiP3 TaxID=2880971 RepID=UPI001EF447E7